MHKEGQRRGDGQRRTPREEVGREEDFDGGRRLRADPLGCGGRGVFLQATNELAGGQRTAGTVPADEKEDSASTPTDAEAREDQAETEQWLAFLRYLNRLRSP